MGKKSSVICSCIYNIVSNEVETVQSFFEIHNIIENLDFRVTYLQTFSIKFKINIVFQEDKIFYLNRCCCVYICMCV